MSEVDELLERLRSLNCDINETRFRKALTLIDEVGGPSDLRIEAIKFAKLVEVQQTLKAYGLLESTGQAISQVHCQIQPDARRESTEQKTNSVRPPINAEYLLYLFLPKADQDCEIGDLVERYGRLARRYNNKRRADFWYYKEVVGFGFSWLRRMVLKIGGLIWLGRILQRLIS